LPFGTVVVEPLDPWDPARLATPDDPLPPEPQPAKVVAAAIARTANAFFMSLSSCWSAQS
jgi:hypothetical protein